MDYTTPTIIIKSKKNPTVIMFPRKLGTTPSKIHHHINTITDASENIKV